MRLTTHLYALGWALVTLSAATGTTGLTRATKAISTSQSAEIYNDIHNQLSKRRGFQEGFVDFGNDGVARAYACNGTIFDALRLSNEQLLAVARAQGDTTMEEGFEGISRHDVPEENLLDPPSDIRLSQPEATDNAIGPSDLCTLASAEDDPPTPQSLNPFRAAKEKLQPRQLRFCEYQRCTTTQACQYLGCRYCAHKKMSRMRQIFGTSHRQPGPWGRGTKKKRTTPDSLQPIHDRYPREPPTKQTPVDPRKMRCYN
ncbi:hypothetical protein BST61_g3310 [Cercospora zeina]